MSATLPPTLEGTETPNPFEVLWERYRSLILTVVVAIVLALIGNYSWKYVEQQGVDQEWSKFAVTMGMEKAYTDAQKSGNGLSELLEDREVADLEAALSGADDAQKPYYHLAIARKAMMDSDWARAEVALTALESEFPDHDLVVSSKMPVQTRDPKKVEDGEEAPDERQWEDGLEGSVVSLMRKELAAAKNFQMPSRFVKPEIPADAPKVKFTLGDSGSFTIALMPNAPEHVKKFLELAAADGGWWKGIAVDEVHRSTEFGKQPYALHFGFASTKDDDRSKWTTTEPSENLVDFEDTGLSHFPGAVAARPQADGKSCADRLWISVDDEANLDGNRVVFGYVVEGLDVLRTVCEAGMSAQEETAGVGRPSESIRVTAVEVL